MRTPLLLTATLILAVAFIYYAGNSTPSATPRPLTKPTVQPTVQPTSRAAPAPGVPLTPDQARQLTSQQRLGLIKKGVLIEYGEQQARYLCNLIEGLTKEELIEACNILWPADKPFGPTLHAHIAAAMCLQWGRLDPLTWIARVRAGQRVGPVIPLETMRGWVETDPAAALAWTPPTDNFTVNFEMWSAGIAFSGVNDPQKLASTFLSFPDGNTRAERCLEDYFKTTDPKTGEPNAAALYENIPVPLRKAAWPYAMEHLTKGDPQVAVDWLHAHLNDPGYKSILVFDLVRRLADMDAVATTKWAATLPANSTNSNYVHPGSAACFVWYCQDPDAALAWLQTQPPTSLLVKESLSKIVALEKAIKPQLLKVEK